MLRDRTFKKKKSEWGFAGKPSDDFTPLISSFHLPAQEQDRWSYAMIFEIIILNSLVSQ